MYFWSIRVTRRSLYDTACQIWLIGKTRQKVSTLRRCSGVLSWAQHLEEVTLTWKAADPNLEWVSFDMWHVVQWVSSEAGSPTLGSLLQFLAQVTVCVKSDIHNPPPHSETFLCSTVGYWEVWQVYFSPLSSPGNDGYSFLCESIRMGFLEFSSFLLPSKDRQL